MQSSTTMAGVIHHTKAFKQSASVLRPSHIVAFIQPYIIMSSLSGYASHHRRSASCSSPTQEQYEAQVAAAILSPTQHSFATHNFSQSILAEYYCMSNYKLGDAMENIDKNMETERERVTQIENFIAEAKTTRAQREKQVDVMKQMLRLHEEGVSNETRNLGKLARNLSNVHKGIKDLAERKEAVMWCMVRTHTPNYNRAHGALSHAASGSSIAIQWEPTNQSSGESEQEELRKMRLQILELESLLKSQKL
jgi:septal ring factor EnvC (AmiA/AmiB activator)